MRVSHKHEGGEEGHEPMADIVAEIPKSKSEKIVVQHTVFKDHALVDVRVFYDAGKLEPEWKPTRKGLSLRPELLPELIVALERAVADEAAK